MSVVPAGEGRLRLDDPPAHGWLRARARIGPSHRHALHTWVGTRRAGQRDPRRAPFATRGRPLARCADRVRPLGTFGRRWVKLSPRRETKVAAGPRREAFASSGAPHLRNRPAARELAENVQLGDWLPAGSAAIAAPGYRMSTRTTPLRPPVNVAAGTALLNRCLVSAYKILGFAILTIVLFGVGAFLCIHSLYVIHRAWLVPAVISPTDPAVLDLRARIADESWKRHKVEGERVGIEAKLERARVVAQLENSFQLGFQSALAGDAVATRASLTTLGALNQERQNVAVELQRISRALEASSTDQLERDYAAKLIDKPRLLQGSYQLAQLAQARLDLRVREVELSERIRGITREVEMLDAVRSGGGRSKNALGYEALVLQREHDRSSAEEIGAQGEARALEQSLVDVDRALVHYENLLATLRAAPLLRATEQQLNLAFMPYENQASMGEGTVVYGCRAAIVLCRAVGRVKQYLPGEHHRNHPVYGHELRGQLVELELEDPEWAKQSVLHGGRPPLFL